MLVVGIEPTSPLYESGANPLSYTSKMAAEVAIGHSVTAITAKWWRPQ